MHHCLARQPEANVGGRRFQSAFSSMHLGKVPIGLCATMICHDLSTSTSRADAMRILVVEDNAELAQWLGRTLRKERYTVDCIANGADADFARTTSKRERRTRTRR